MTDTPSESTGTPAEPNTPAEPTAQVPADWYPDPQGRHEHRYWDGSKWTDHVSNSGVTAKDPVTKKKSRMERFEAAVTVGNEGDRDKVKKQLSDQGHRGAGIGARVAGGGGSLFTEPILVVNQKAKVVELTSEHSVFDQDGNKIASVNQVGQSTAKKAMRLVSGLDQYMTHHMEITDAAGQVLLRLVRPRKFVKSSVLVKTADDVELGRIVQQNAIGKIRFGLESNGETLGKIKAENWRAWNFRIEDGAGTEVARITKTWEGFAKTAFTTADNYVVQIHQRMPEPFNSLIVASSLCVDTALKQDARGLN